MNDLSCLPASPSPSDVAQETTIATVPGRGKKNQKSGVFSGTAGKRILIVEDDVSLAGFLSTELQSQQFTVDVLHDGEEACRVLEEKRRYDLLILDLNLPRLDGIGLIERVRPSYPKMPMMVLTARSRV